MQECHTDREPCRDAHRPLVSRISLAYPCGSPASWPIDSPIWNSPPHCFRPWSSPSSSPRHLRSRRARGRARPRTSTATPGGWPRRRRPSAPRAAQLRAPSSTPSTWTAASGPTSSPPSRPIVYFDQSEDAGLDHHRYAGPQALLRAAGQKGSRVSDLGRPRRLHVVGHRAHQPHRRLAGLDAAAGDAQAPARPADHGVGRAQNPQGARALYLGSTIYRIHGTNNDRTVGRANSSGCFRLTNEHVVHLASIAKVGAKVRVMQAYAGGVSENAPLSSLFSFWPGEPAKAAAPRKEAQRRRRQPQPLPRPRRPRRSRHRRRRRPRPPHRPTRARPRSRFRNILLGMSERQPPAPATLASNPFQHPRCGGQSSRLRMRCSGRKRSIANGKRRNPVSSHAAKCARRNHPHSRGRLLCSLRPVKRRRAPYTDTGYPQCPLSS